MDAQLKAKWIEALRSGAYVQSRFNLTDGFGFCCIGVGYQVLVGDCADLGNDYGDPTDKASNALKLPAEIASVLVRMNDDENRSFAEIADYIETSNL